MKSYMGKTSEIDRKWYVIDAKDMVLGRLATEVSKVLMGKHKATYTPHLDMGDFVIILNAGQVKLTGKKLDQKKHYYHTGYPGGLKEIAYKDMMKNKPERAIEYAVKGMLPKTSLGRKMIKKMKVYRDEEHNHGAQKPEKYVF